MIGLYGWSGWTQLNIKNKISVFYEYNFNVISMLLTKQKKPICDGPSPRQNNSTVFSWKGGGSAKSLWVSQSFVISFWFPFSAHFAGFSGGGGGGGV